MQHKMDQFLLPNPLHIASINLQKPVEVEDMLLPILEFKELQKLTVNQALIKVYKEYPMVEAVLNTAIVEITKDVQQVVHRC